MRIGSTNALFPEIQEYPQPAGVAFDLMEKARGRGFAFVRPCRTRKTVIARPGAFPGSRGAGPRLGIARPKLDFSRFIGAKSLAISAGFGFPAKEQADFYFAGEEDLVDHRQI